MKDKIERQKAIAVNRMREFIRLQGKAISTERSYCRQIARYVGFITSRNWPEGASSESKLEAFLNAEAKRDVASSTQNGAFHAICYKDIETTARYVRPQPERVPSPIINLNLAKAQ